MNINQIKDIRNDLDLLDWEFMITNTHYMILKELGPLVTGKGNELNQFLDYFYYDFMAHTKSFFIGLNKFFDKDPRSSSLNNIFKKLDNLDKNYYQDLVNRYEQFHAKYDEYRHKTVAHLERNRSSILPKLTFIGESFSILTDIKRLICKLKDQTNYQGRFIDYHPLVIEKFKTIKKYLIDHIKEIKNKRNLPVES